MAETPIHSLASTLATQPMSLPEQQQQQISQTTTSEPIQTSTSDVSEPPIATAEPNAPDQPVKRKPGRPKGSGKKLIDPNAEPKTKRPVGRPRKDGLPAGSVGPRRPSRPRKRPPGTFASGPHAPPVYPYASAPFPTFSADSHPAWRASISVPPMGSIPRQLAYPIDPNLDRNDWGELARKGTDVFLQTLVAALASPNPVSGAGPSVEEAFKSHLVSLAPNSKNTPSIPSLYSILKTFWLPTSPVYFSLTASASTARTPSEHRFLYWDPQPLVFNGIACPACSSPLVNRGRISSGPIKIYDLGKPFFIIGCEYVCKSTHCVTTASPEGRKFASTDSSILRALPLKLKDEFPALLSQGNTDLGSGPDVWNWHGMGVSLALWNMVKASLRRNLSKDVILDIITAIQVGTVEEEFERKWEDDAEEEEEDHDAEEVDGDLNTADADEFHEAWNANSGAAGASASAVVNSNSEQPQAGPSNSAQSGGNQETEQQPAPASASTASMNPPAQQPPAATYPPIYGQGTYVPYAYPYPYFPPHQPEMHGGASALKRTFAIMEGSSDPALSEPMQKRIRHCCKCGSNDCKGKGGRSFCTNACQDCGKMDCKGRNSKRPDRTCENAWP